MRKRKKILIIGIMAVTVWMTACQKSPDSSIVVNKDFDNMISEAQNSEGAVELTDLAKNYDIYQAAINDESFGVSVNVNAKVDIPETEQLSVFRVRQKGIEQEMLDKVLDNLVNGETLYDGGMDLRCRSIIEAEISELKEFMSNLPDDSEWDDYRKEYQASIDELEKDYEKAPDEPAWEENMSDGLIHPVKEMYEKDTENSFYSWEYDLNSDGEVYYGISDGRNGNYVSVFVQNNANRGNWVRYRSSRHGYIFIAAAVSQRASYGMWDAAQGMPDPIQMGIDADMNDFIEYTDESVTLSADQARKMADELLQKLEIEGFEYYSGGLYYEIPDIRESTVSEKMGYRKIYMLQYKRNIDGVFVTNEGGSKHAEGWSGNDYVKKDWSEECIEIYINDDGIVGFDYFSPLEVTETIVSKSSLKPFEEIKNIFEQMVVVVNAREYSRIALQVDRVRLGYTRISEADSYDTGLLVPVWNFIGTRSGDEELYKYQDTESLLTINAIDGSVIDGELGY